ncbi:hypothetical protein D477_016135 [Arthrobacter crystallopoietes BAB-32]|uniref:tRNA threonylcarbamoyladenosine biosynthesis protein TsaE n=1 Tax=Arthrobacter crystallopoietes BAB-32 TaxID=1246476 RepID=N1V4N0_9MICC|nr:hypothetical protein D477_016135 [Arthrobacter crystallopoietes BAB-32]
MHPSLSGGPDLVHVDAYRLESEAEIDDIDLENTLDSSVTVVEWGRGRVEHLTDSWLDISLHRSTGTAPAGNTGAADGGSTGVVLDFAEPDETEDRLISMAAYGPRWAEHGPF